jgi:hypothetical protein
LQEKGRVLEAIQQEIFWTGCNEVTAYRRVMHAEQNPSPADEETEEEEEEAKGFADGDGKRVFGENIFPPDFNVREFDRWSPRKQTEFENFYETMAALFEDLTGMEAMDFEEALRQERERRGGARKAKSGGKNAESGGYEYDYRSHPTAPNEAPSQARETSRLKELYRNLVRRLHPDHHHKQTPTERELWHQVQEAYRTGNVEALESISGRLDVGLNGNSNHLPVQIILRMARDLRSALRSLQRQITGTRKHPAWAFRSKASELPAFEAKRRKEITQQQRDAQRDLADATAILADLAARAAKPERTHRAQRQSHPPRAKPRSRSDCGQAYFQF